MNLRERCVIDSYANEIQALVEPHFFSLQSRNIDRTISKDKDATIHENHVKEENQQRPS